MCNSPAIRFQRTDKLLEVTTTPIGKVFLCKGFLLGDFFLDQGFNFTQSISQVGKFERKSRTSVDKLLSFLKLSFELLRVSSGP